MQKKSILKSISLKKQMTLTEARRQEWPLPPEYLKVIFLLSLIRKVIRNLASKIKQNEVKQSMKSALFHKLNSSHENGKSFDYIAPVNKNIEDIKATREAYVELKKQILGFLKQVKITSQIQKTQRLKKCESNVNFNLTNQEVGNTFVTLPVTVPVFGKKSSKDESIGVSSSVSQSGIGQLNESQPFSTVSNSNIGSNTTTTTKLKRLLLGSSEHPTQSYLITAKKLQTKLKTESLTFQKFNKTLSTFCQTPDSKGSLQLFQLYLHTLFELKNSLAYSINLIAHQSQTTKERIYFMINLLIKGCREVFGLCRSLAQFCADARERMAEYVAVYGHLLGVTDQVMETCSQVQGEVDKGEEELLSGFIKKLNFMIQITKIMIGMSISPNMSHSPQDKRRQKALTSLTSSILAKLSQFRYTTSYLTSQIQALRLRNYKQSQTFTHSHSQGASKNNVQYGLPDDEENQKENFEMKWRSIYQRKFGSARGRGGWRRR